MPACFSNRFIGAAAACHHLRCNFRSSLRRPASPVHPSDRITRCMSYWDQSEGDSPVPASLHARVLRSALGPLSGPRPAGAPEPEALDEEP